MTTRRSPQDLGLTLGSPFAILAVGLAPDLYPIAEADPAIRRFGHLFIHSWIVKGAA